MNGVAAAVVAAMDLFRDPTEVVVGLLAAAAVLALTSHLWGLCNDPRGRPKG